MEERKKFKMEIPKIKKFLLNKYNKSRPRLLQQFVFIKKLLE